MCFKVSLLVSFFLLFFFFDANAFNITQLLDQYPAFSTFNNYLTQTQLAAAINGRRTITVLVVDNGGTSPLSGKPTEVLMKIMSVHVVLDYYDVSKLQKLPNKTTSLTTLFQASGRAVGQQGFLNVTDLSTGSVVFASAVHGSTLGANLVKSVASQPYNISVLQISSVIIPNGIDGPSTNSSSSPTGSPQLAPGPAASPGNSGAPPATSPEKPPSTAPAPSVAPAAGGFGSPPKPGDAPAADASNADAPAGKSPNSSVALRLCPRVVMTIALSALSLMSVT
ncbi:hypothetical protein U1Q18_006900 [Sarracenia purpurea var. burkii]